jgi:exonuclease VII small subunit
MVDAYKHNPSEIDSIVSSLKTQLNNYNEKLSELKGLVTKIETSKSWIDAVLKTSFISACNSYIKIYEQVAARIDTHIKYLIKKSAGAETLEKSFSR